MLPLVAVVRKVINTIDKPIKINTGINSWKKY